MSCTAFRCPQIQSRRCQLDHTPMQLLPMPCTHLPPSTTSWHSFRTCLHRRRLPPHLPGHMLHLVMQSEMLAAVQRHLALLPPPCLGLVCKILRGMQQPVVLRDNSLLNGASQQHILGSRTHHKVPTKQNIRILSLGRYAVQNLYSLSLQNLYSLSEPALTSKPSSALLSYHAQGNCTCNSFHASCTCSCLFLVVAALGRSQA